MNETVQFFLRSRNAPYGVTTHFQRQPPVAPLNEAHSPIQPRER